MSLFTTENNLPSWLIFFRHTRCHIGLVTLRNAHSVLLAGCPECISSVFYHLSCPHWILTDLFDAFGWSQCFSTTTNLTYKINLGVTETKVTAAPEWCVQLQTGPHRVDMKQRHCYSLDSSFGNATVYAFHNSNLLFLQQQLHTWCLSGVNGLRLYWDLLIKLWYSETLQVCYVGSQPQPALAQQSLSLSPVKCLEHMVGLFQCWLQFSYLLCSFNCSS